MADMSAVKEITAKLENGVKELFESEKYLEYLKTMSRFHRYSTRNTLLIHMQMPKATRVAGFSDWKNKFKRQVKKGEHGIRILAPVMYKKTVEKDKIDEDTNTLIIGNDGQPVREEVEIKIARFKVVCVFDISQTEGEPLPELIETLTGNVERYELFIDTLKAVSPLPIVFENMPLNIDGTCYFGDKIKVREGMSEVQTICAIIHELTHAKPHDLAVVSESGENPKDKRTEEVEAESVSYVVCQYFGIDTGANSFGYLAEWSKSHELKELNTSLDTIRKTATDIINNIEEKYSALAKERGIDLTVVNTSPKEQEKVAIIDEKTEVKNTLKLDLTLPDPTVTAAEMSEYGYTEPDMYPLSAERAAELFDTEHPIYLLYPDNTEALAFDRDEIITFCDDGLCGITKADWEMSPVFAAQKAITANSEINLESELLYGNENKFGIYQIKEDIPDARNIRFTPMDELEKHGLKVDRSNYELVYIGKLDIRDTLINLNKIYDDFNNNHPADFTGRSVSVSDVIVLQWRGEVSAHYVGSVGFNKLPVFTGNERETLIPLTLSQVGNSSNSPTISEFEADVKAGKSIPLLGLPKAVNREKPSLLDKLEKNKQRAAQQGQSAAYDKNNLEV